MPHYVNNPENPGQHIDANELVRRNPLTPPPPDSRIVGGLLKRDTWTRREAIAILAGADTRHAREYFHGVPIPTGYLDGTTALSLQAAGLHHPLHEDISAACSMLDSYSEGQDMDEKRTPSEWLEWAKSKGFRPYWLAEPAPKSAPAGKAVTIAGPPPMGNSTKGKRAHPLAAQIRKAQAQAEKAGDAAARWERGAVWAPLRAMALEECEPFTGAVSAKGLEYTDAANCRQVFTPEALAAHLKRQREKVTPADAIRR